MRYLNYAFLSSALIVASAAALAQGARALTDDEQRQVNRCVASVTKQQYSCWDKCISTWPTNAGGIFSGDKYKTQRAACSKQCDQVADRKEKACEEQVRSASMDENSPSSVETQRSTQNTPQLPPNMGYYRCEGEKEICQARGGCTTTDSGYSLLIVDWANKRIWISGTGTEGLVNRSPDRWISWSGNTIVLNNSVGQRNMTNRYIMIRPLTLYFRTEHTSSVGMSSVSTKDPCESNASLGRFFRVHGDQIVAR